MKVRALVVGIAAMGLLVPFSGSMTAAATTNADSASKTAYYVTQTMTVQYNTTNCGGHPAMQMVVISTKYTRSNTNRKVKVDKLFAGQFGTKCNGSADTLSKQVNIYPVFGCNGRCGSNTTEDRGFSVSWPYMRTDMSFPLSNIGASSNGYITTGSGTNLGTICTKLTYVAPGAACK